MKCVCDLKLREDFCAKLLKRLLAFEISLWTYKATNK